MSLSVAVTPKWYLRRRLMSWKVTKQHTCILSNRLCASAVWQTSVAACQEDICFVVDHSGSIRDTNPPFVDNWQLLINFMVRVVSDINIGPTMTHVGVVTFGQYLKRYRCATDWFIYRDHEPLPIRATHSSIFYPSGDPYSLRYDTIEKFSISLNW